jgi:SAM-dependent methyltransferase
MVEAWVWAFMIVVGGLFAVKMVYVLSTAAAVNATGGALYVSTSRKRIEAALKMVVMQPEQTLVDLGCGDGRVLRMAARRFRVSAVGYEINPLAYFIARVLCLGREKIRVRRENFWKIPLASADVVFCYLYPDVMRPLVRKLRKDLKPGTPVISCNFPLPGLQPECVARPAGLWGRDPVYLYRMPRGSPG